MRRERWWWLVIFLVVSVLIHLLIGWRSRSFSVAFAPPDQNQIEITLEPPDKAVPKPKPPKEKPPRPPKTVLLARHEHRPRPFAAPRTRTARRVAPTRRTWAALPRVAPILERRPETRKRVAGGVDTTKLEKPLPLNPSLAKISPHMPSAHDLTLPTPEKTAHVSSPITPDTPHNPDPPRRVAAVTPTVRLNKTALAMPNLLDASGTPDEKPEVPTRTTLPRMTRRMTPDNSLAGGGSPAPDRILAGHNGAVRLETPTDDLLWNGGGHGGAKLPRMAMRIGGGGGLSVLSVHNPLGDPVPDETPGTGPGRKGGEGAGTGGGAGFGRDRGQGTGLDGRLFASLRGVPGVGLGAGHGSHRGTFAPGGGRGPGAEMPGTGGEGLGYGRGHAVGIGNGFRDGLGAGGHSLFGSGGGGGVGEGPQVASRGIPFGDITGLLRGNPNGGGGRGGGPGGSGSGLGAGGRPGGGASIQMVYLLDVSGSMRNHDKIGKARGALKKALLELKHGDSFNIITFDAQTYPLADTMQRATPANIQKAIDFMEGRELDQHPGTNMSQVLEMALALPQATQIFLMSDGEPQWAGITNFDELRRDVREKNARKVPIYTLAMGVGERFKGMDLMRGLADDNQGQFHYINLSGDAPTTNQP